MGQSQTYSDYALEKDIISLEHELIAIKTKQLYSTDQAQAFTSNSVSVSSYSHTYAGPCVAMTLRFTGEYVNTVAVGNFCPVISPSSASYDGSEYINPVWYRYIFSSASPNVLEGYLWLTAPKDFSATITAKANMPGKLELVEIDNLNWLEG